MDIEKQTALDWFNGKSLAEIAGDYEKWDRRFLGMAAHIAGWSRDPSTQVGAVIVHPDKTIASLGFNGFPRGVNDDESRYNDRELKYKLVVHAEANAIVAANTSLRDCKIYTWPFPPCSSCTGLIIQSGITAVVAPEPTAAQIERWGNSFDLSRSMLSEAGVEFITYEVAVAA